MADKFTKEKRSAIMRAIKGRDTLPEEVRGCFWHHHGWTWDGRKLVQVEVGP